MPKNLLLPFYQRLLSLYRRHFVYLFQLCIFFLLQLLLFSLSLILVFFNFIPIYFSLSLIISSWIFLIIGLFGTFKNLQALVRGRGQEKYPLFMWEYFFGGLKLFIHLLIFLLPLLVSLIIFIFSLYNNNHALLLIALSLFIFTFFIQWYFGLTLTFFIDRKNSIFINWSKSFTFIDLHKRVSFVVIASNYLLLIILSVFLPFFGTVFTINWIILSSFFFSTYFFTNN